MCGPPFFLHPIRGVSYPALHPDRAIRGQQQGEGGILRPDLHLHELAIPAALHRGDNIHDQHNIMSDLLSVRAVSGPTNPSMNWSDARGAC